MKSRDPFQEELKSGYRASQSSNSIRRLSVLKYLLVFLLTLLLTSNAKAQLVGSPSSGQSAVQYCAPGAQYVVRFQYEVSFSVVPAGWFRMLFRLEDQAGNLVASQNYFNNASVTQITVVQDVNPPYNWLISRNHTFTLPADDDCEYNARIWFYEDPEMDGSYSVVDLTQVQVLANWHTDDDGDGIIAVTPPIHEVCEGEGLIGFQFQDASTFSCTSSTTPALAKPNFYERHVQFVYNTSALAAQGIPNLTISVYGTPVQLTDATGAPMPNSWNVNPLDGTIIAPYTTTSGYFEGPVISTGLNATGGSQQSFPIDYPAGGTVVNDYFEVTLRNWNFCNPWNGSQTNPNAGIARTATARIVIVDAPPAPGVQDATVCEGSGDRTLRTTTAPIGAYYWYSDAALTVPVANNVSSYLPPETTPGVYDYYVVDQDLTGLLCVGPPAVVLLTVYSVISNNTIAADQTICSGSAPAALTGTPPAGGNTTYAYLWEHSTGGAGGPFAAAAGANTNQNYSPPALTQNTWFRRSVISGPCTSYSNVVAVTVRPTPTATISGATTVCQAAASPNVRFTNPQSLPVTITYNINGGSNQTVNVNASTFTNVPAPTDVAGSFAYNLVSVSYQTVPNCPNAISGTATVVVRPTPSATISGTTSVCQNAPSPLITFSNPMALTIRVTYRINGGADQTIDVNPLSTNTRSVSTVTPNTYTYSLVSVRYTTNPTCSYAISGSAVVTVNPLPAPTITGTASVCLNSTHSYSTEAGMSGYVWSISAGGTINSGAGTNTISVTWTTTGTRSLTVTYTNANSCTGTSLAYTVLVGDSPTGATITGTDACFGSASTIRVTITGGATNYTILIPEYSATPIANYVSGTDINLGLLSVGSHTYTLSSALDACTNPVPGLPTTVTINVNPIPVVTPGANPVVCRGTTSTTITYTGATGSPDGYSIDYSAAANTAGFADVTNAVLPAGSITITVPAAAPAATYTANLTVSNIATGCVSTVYPISVTVNPTLAITPGTNPSVCRGTTSASLTYSSPSGSPDRYSLDFNAAANTAGFADIVNAALPASPITIVVPAAVTAPATYSGSLTVTNSTTGCVSAIYPVSVTVYAIPSINPGANPSVCRGTTSASLTYSSSSASPNRYSIDYNAAANTAGFTDVVNAVLPVSPITLVVPAGVAAPGVYSGNLTVSNNTTGCVSPVYPITVTVNPLPTITPGSNPAVCRGTTSASLTYGGATGSPNRYSIDYSAAANTAGFTDVVNDVLPASPITLVVPAGANPATYTANLTVSNSATGCASTAYPVTVTVHPIPVLNSTLTPPDVCSNTPFTYTATSATPGTSFSWVRAAVPGITPAGPTSGPTSLVNETLRNLTSASIPVTYEFSLSANGCPNVQNVVVNIKPEPVISNQSVNVCSGESLSHRILLDNFTNPGDNVTFTWPAPVLSGGLSGGTARLAPSSADMIDSFVNTSGLAETATYFVTPVYNGCTGQARNIVVTVGSQPVLDPGLNRFACSAVPTGLVMAVAPSSSPATTYDINLITVQAGLVAAAGNAVVANGIVDPNYLANDWFTNETGGNRTVTYRIRPVFGATCIGDWVNVVVTIRPQPVILPGQGRTVCSNSASNFEIHLVPVNTPAGSTFSWPMPVMSDASPQGSTGTNVAADPAGTLHITDVFENYGITPITATYSVTPYSSFSCQGTPVDVVITVNPEPAAPVITGDDLLCTDQSGIVYMVTLHPGSSYTWNVPASVGTKTFDANSNAIIITAAATAGNGTITVTETNSYGCTGIAGTFDVDILAPSPQSAITGDDVVCALETAIYSVPNYAGSVYTWTLPTGAALIGDPSAASITVTFGTVSGSISVREVNAAGCITNHTPLPVTVRPLPTAVISNSGTICIEDTHPVNIALTGTAPWSVVHAINGVDQPAINIAASPFTLNVNIAGNYTVTSVTDANGCTSTGVGNATVSFFPVPTATISGTTEMCAGGSAVLTITLTGATPYDFVYTDGVTPVTVINHAAMVYTATVTPAVPTTYTVTSMNDNNGCEGTPLGSAVVTINPTPALTLAGSNLLCLGDNSGAVNLTVNSGTAPFSFAWSGPDGFTSGTEDISGLRAGYYTVTVTDSKGCTASGNITITQPTVLTLSGSGNILLQCNGAANGSGSFTAAGGTMPYLFNELVNTPGATLTYAASSVSVTNAGAGTITVRVTDANGCTAESTILITEPTALNIAATTTNILCFGGNNGMIITTATGGTPPYLYAWTASAGGSGITAGASNQSGLTAGTYDVIVTDASGCQTTGSWILTQPTALVVIVTTDDNLIGTCSDAQLNTAVTGGVEPAGGYLYSWSPAAGLSAANIANPVAAPASTTTYTVTVTDANGCIKAGSVTVSVAPVLTAVAFADDNLIGTCPGSEAQLDVTVNGGEAPYSFSWLPVAGLTPANIRNPIAKPAVNTTYTVTVTDANGCTVTADVTINIAPPLTATATVDDYPIGACPTSVAHLSTIVSGGEGGYTYLWDNAATLDDATKANPTAKPGVSTLYTVTVTDSNGCTTTAQVQVNVAPDLSVTATADDDIIGACPSSDAILTATGAGGELLLSGDYTYNWSPAAGLNYTNVKSPVAKPAVTTIYTVTITDSNGCAASDQVTITVMPSLALTTTPLVYTGGYNITCNGASDGAIDLGVTGGEMPYAYSWSGPAGFTSTAQDINGLVAGTYSVTVTDANNCISTTAVVLLEPAVLTLGTTPDVLLACFGDATATGSFSVSGGTAPYVLSVVSDNTGATVNITATSLAFTGAAAGTITAGVVDANGCTAQATITITQPLELIPGTIDGTQEVCYLGNPTPLNELTAPAGGSTVILVQWENSTNGGVNWNNVPGATMASYDPPAGILQTTHFRRRVNSAACDPAYSDTVIVTVNPLPVASIAGAGFVCPGDAATLTVTVTTGESPFTVVLSDGTTVANYLSGSPITVNPITTTTYTITSVTDNNGCVVSAPHADLTGSATIDVKVIPEIVLQPVNTTVCEDDVATFTTDAGFTTNPQYQWYVDTGSGMTLMPGENSATIIVTAVTAMNGNQYQVVISGDCPLPVTSTAATLTVNEKPEIIAQPIDVTLCSGEDATFTVDAGVTTNPLYQWFVDSGSGWTLATGARYQGANTATLTVVSALEMMSGYQYMVRVSGICTPYVESLPVTITVTRQAEITQHPASITLCEGLPAVFTVNAGLTTNPSYLWEISIDGGLNWTTITGAVTATYTIPAVSTTDNSTAYRATVSSSCGSAITSMPAFLTVNELPEITDQPDDVIICEYAIADFIVDAGVTTGASYSWQRSTDGGASWSNLTETATYFGVSTMNLKVNGTNRTMSGDLFRVIVSGTCTPPISSSTALLTVNTAPEILAQPVASSICENASTSFIVTAQGTAITYQWFVDTGSGFAAVSNGGVYSGAISNTLTLTNVSRTYDNYLYRVEVEGTCVPKAISQTVQLDVSVETTINTQPADSAICEFMTASFSALAEGANLSYQWQTFDGTSWVNLSNTGLYLGVQTPTLMVFGPARTMDGTRYRVVIGGDCSADLTSSEAMLTVYTAPELSDHPDEFKGCPAGNATFSVVAAGTNLVYQWQVNSGSGFVNVTDNATYSGTTTPDFTISNLDLTMNGYLVRAVVSGTCQPPVTSSFAPLRVYTEPSVITEPADAEVCDLANVTFYSQVYNTGAGETTVWQVNQGSGWITLGDGALYQGTQTSQLVIMSATTPMNGWHYRLEITGPCGLYYSREALLTVNEWPTAQIAPVDTLLVCGGVPTQLHGNPAGGSLSYSTHRWYGDIGPLSQYSIENPVFNTSVAGYYRLIYQVTDSKGCVGLDTLVVEVEKPVAMFTVDTPSGCQPLTVNFTNGSTGYVSVLWNFGDTNTSTDINTTHTYPNLGSSLAYYTVRLEVTSANGCVSSMENNITVYPEILSDFTISNDTICSGETIMFSTIPSAARYDWTYGDGNQETGSNVINHVYFNTTTAPVTYNVTLRTESFYGCISETTMPVVVYPTPLPAFIATPASQVYPAATVTFTNNTNAGTWSWLWDFDDGNTSSDMSPVHTYDGMGDFDVSLTVTNGVCSATVSHVVRILPTPPVAEFDSIPSGCAPWTITPNNTSLAATGYYWDFGDGYTSNARNPSYTYLQAGTYQITLTVTGPGGSDTKSQIVNVYASPKAYFEVSPTEVYVNDEEVRMFNLTEGGDSFIWEFGDGDTSHLRDPSHKYTTEGIYDITLHAYSANGCYDTYTMSPGVTVEPFGDLVFATVFMPSPDGPIEIDELPTSGEAMDQFFYPPIRETVLEYHMQIFSRWGTLIFETYDINKPWNGYYKGNLCQQGVYVWLVEGKYANGRPFKKAGDITLLH